MMAVLFILGTSYFLKLLSVLFSKTKSVHKFKNLKGGFLTCIDLKF